ncbi:sterol desaturase family protein [Kordia algicida OT-1]|uniref:Sterol desaturase-related protein n=1 Tax=Kordia algicida OT-1 TaxID=391587 RepID=A9DI90_9FLAO|nr:sterol desaturase family protein [Kordia algicida]EDP97856.1 sterol desaturase-related protein [Kordia algicida OT-1]
MDTILSYFESIPSSHRSAILVGGIAFFWLIEYIIPLIRFNYKKVNHAGINIFFTLTTIVVNFVLAFLLLKASDWAVANNFGILEWIKLQFPELSIWWYALIGVALLDFFGAWLAHYVEHRVPFLWRFHLVHHTDTHVDTTTANRHHPGESVIRFIFTLAGVVIVGAPVGIIMLYQSMSVVLSQFNHANISIPKNVDKWLSYIIVSPNMHKVHHHHVLPYTDTNYGNIFSIWDRIFQTFATKDPETLVYGVDTYPDASENANLKSLLKIPFNKYRPPTTLNSDE